MTAQGWLRPAVTTGVAAAFCLIAGANGASAQTNIGLDEARTLVFKLVADGAFDEASALARTILKSDPNDHAALLALAQSERAAGRTAAAVKAAKAAWRNSHSKPEKYASSVVAAQALSTSGKPMRAQLWLRRAAQHAPNAALEARAKRDYKLVRSNTPASVTLRFSAAPSSNINNGSKSDTIEIAGLPFAISGDAQALSGIEYNLGATLSYRLPQTGAWALTASGAVDAKYFSLSSKAKRQAPNVSGADYAFEELGFRLDARKLDADREGATTLSIAAGQNWYGAAPLTRFASVGAGRQIKAGERSSLSFDVEYEKQWRQDDDSRSADVVSFSATWGHRFASGGAIWVTGHASDTAAKSAAIAQQTLGASIRFAPAKELIAGTSIEFSLGYQNRSFDRALPLFERREDNRVSASALMTFRNLDYFGFAPTAELSASRTSSTVTQYDIEDLGLKFGLRSTF